LQNVLTTCLAVSTQYRTYTDIRTDRVATTFVQRRAANASEYTVCHKSSSGATYCVFAMTP